VSNRVQMPLRFARQRGSGFTLVELTLAVCIAAILAAIAIPSYRATVLSMRAKEAVHDLVQIAQAVERHRYANSFKLPASLSELANLPTVDPWGNPYEYLRFEGAVPGKIRKDHNLHPLNSEFDLYSMGPDGKSVPPLTGRPSRDDVIWANDGKYVGVAEDY
jgi:general secretion pathway protein G